MAVARKARLQAGHMVLGHFRLEARLGRGGQGEVWQAFDTRLKRPVAIKFLHPELALDPDYVTRFERETQTAAKFKHHNIGRLHDAGQWEGRLFMIMELLDGESLRIVLAHRPRLDIVEAVFYATQILEALREAHADGVVHRDVGPANVIIGKKGHAWLCDFGIAVRREVTRNPARATARSSMVRAAKESSLIGTPAFMSPEQINGQPVDHRSDLYALGVLLYRMLAGQFPFLGVDYDQDTAVLAAHALLEPEPLPDVIDDFPEALWAIVRRLLAKDPRERYPSAEEASEELYVFLRGSVPPNHPVAQLVAVERRNAVARAQFEKRRPERELEAAQHEDDREDEDEREAPAARDLVGGRSTMPLGVGYKVVSPCAFLPENPWDSERLATVPPAPPARTAKLERPAELVRVAEPAQIAEPAAPARVDAARLLPLVEAAGESARAVPSSVPASSPWAGPVHAPQAAPLVAPPVSAGRAWAPVSGSPVIVYTAPSVRAQIGAAFAAGVVLALLGTGGIVAWRSGSRPAAAAAMPAEDAGVSPGNAAEIEPPVEAEEPARRVPEGPSPTVVPVAVVPVAVAPVAVASAAPSPRPTPARAPRPETRGASTAAPAAPRVQPAPPPAPVIASAAPPAVVPAPAPAATAPHRLFESER